MLKNYLKVAWRHLLQNKGFSFINIFGLAIGMAFAILIGLWIQYEVSFDKFHKNGDRIAMVLKNTFFNNAKSTQSATPLPLYYEFKNTYPEVEYASRLDWGGDVSMMVGDKKFNRTGRYVDPDFLKMFSFPIVKGNAETALNDIHSIIITESLATALFGNSDPIGKSIKMNNEFNVSVSAVMKDGPKNSSLQFDFLGPYEYLMSVNEFYRNQKANWGNNFLQNVVQLKEGVSMEAFSAKIKMLNLEKDKTLKDLYLFLQPLKDWHLKNEYKDWVPTGAKFEYVRLFGIIGIFVLLIACINFMNLSTARSEKRAREVGIRKAIGSLRSQLIIQFLTETLLTALLAFLVAIVLIPIVLPLLKDLGFENIRFDPGNFSLLLFILAIAVVTGLIAGSYPALYLSSFMPVKVLKGLFKQGQGAVTFRRVLVVSQFTISIGLIISTVIVFQQIEHARSRSIGYDPNNLLRIGTSNDLLKNFTPLKSDLMRTGYVESVAKSSGPLTAIWNSWSDFEWEGKEPNSQIAIDVIMSEWDFEKTAGMKFKMGRPFSREYKTDSNAIILTETALNMIGYKDPVGKTMKVGGRTITIVGVVEDMLVVNPYQPVNPTVLLFNADVTNFVYLRLKDNAPLKKAIATIEPIFEKYNPAFPFEFKFSDQEFEQKFNLERQAGKLAGIFATLAVFISCLGLFGLAAFMAERRTKEIGIRKVLGASMFNLWTLLSKEFVWLVITGCLIATPLAFLLMSKWLQSYDYRINIQWWVFVAAGVVALVVALVTVSSQAIKAAIANPVKSLRSE
ncbi:MAG: ABC transporter permease [Chitinophagaceae bacterium]|nr:ABC transporter permease [Chitinophagaceae bacterium]